MDYVGPAIGVSLFVLGMSFVKEPTRGTFNAIIVAGASGVHLSGGFGVLRYRQEPRFINNKSLAIGQNHRALNHVLQLADISRPIVRLQYIERLLAYFCDFLADAFGVTIDQVFKPRAECRPGARGAPAFESGKH